MIKKAQTTLKIVFNILGGISYITAGYFSILQNTFWAGGFIILGSFFIFIGKLWQ